MDSKATVRTVMGMTARATLTIGEVGELTGLTTHTLRFYEQEGLFLAPVRRDTAGRRVFTDDEVEWLKVCTRLRSSGMPLDDIRHYARLVVAGPDTVAERFAILRGHEARVQAQIDELHEALGVIRRKVEIYSDHLAAGTADELWRNGPTCAPDHRPASGNRRANPATLHR